MDKRITKGDLETLCFNLNEHFKPTPEHYFEIQGAFGGYILALEIKKPWSHQDVLGTGYIPKRELHTAIQYFRRGLRFKQQNNG